VIYHSNPEFESSQAEIVIVDEADYFILRDPNLFLTKFKQNKVICLTATPQKDEQDSIENQVLTDLKFKLFQFWPDHWERKDKLGVDRILQPINEQ